METICEIGNFVENTKYYNQNIFKQSGLKFLFLALLIFCCSSLSVDAAAYKYQLTPDSKSRIAVAKVGVSRVDFSQIYNIWGPTWRHIISNCQRGGLTAREADKQLQKNWEEAMQTVVREEIFYQEAGRKTELNLANIAKQIYAIQSGHAPSSNNNPAYQAIFNKRKNQYLDQVDEYINNTIEHHAKKLGGKKNLLAVLERQGTLYEDWKTRIRRKAIIDIFLSNTIPQSRIAEPRPSEIRAYYKKNIRSFMTPGHKVFRHILFSFKKNGGEEKTRKLASTVFLKIRKKTISFVDAARQYSNDKVSVAYGGIEPLPEPATAQANEPGRLIWMKELRGAVNNINKKGFGPMLVSNAGCHLIFLLRVEAGKKIPFTKAQQSIANTITSKKREALIENLYQDLLESVRVEIILKKFPDSYSWSTIKKFKPQKVEEKSSTFEVKPPAVAKKKMPELAQ